ncbi:hypothetical protein ACT17T_03475 [Cytobacillus kochii]
MAYSQIKGELIMNPLERKALLKEKFIHKKNKGDQKVIALKDIKLTLNSEVVDYYKQEKTTRGEQYE